MTTKDEALKMAIEAMQTCDLETGTWSAVDIALAIHACKEALASNCEALEQSAQLDLPQQRWSKEKEMIESWQQPAQEPVAWRYKDWNDKWVLSDEWNQYYPKMKAEPLYTHPAPSCSCKDKK